MAKYNEIYLHLIVKFGDTLTDASRIANVVSLDKLG